MSFIQELNDQDGVETRTVKSERFMGSPKSNFNLHISVLVQTVKLSVLCIRGTDTTHSLGLESTQASKPHAWSYTQRCIMN